MRNQPSCFATFSLTAAALLMSSMIGCQSSQIGPNDVTFNSVKGNLTPELVTLSDSQNDVDRDIAVNFNQNLRMFWDDMGYVWMTDRPSSLSNYPVVTTTGQP